MVQVLIPSRYYLQLLVEKNYPVEISKVDHFRQLQGYAIRSHMKKYLRVILRNIHTVENKKSQSGQTLVILILFVIIAILITTASTFTLIVNIRGADKVLQSDVTYDIAESGVENAILKLLRDPSYSGETITVGSG